MAAKLRAGVIGCGAISRNHVGGYINSGRFDVVALADLNPDAMNDMDQHFGISTVHYTHAREMMAREKTE